VAAAAADDDRRDHGGVDSVATAPGRLLDERGGADGVDWRRGVGGPIFSLLRVVVRSSLKKSKKQKIRVLNRLGQALHACVCSAGLSGL